MKTISIEQYIKHLDQKEIPPCSPEGTVGEEHFPGYFKHRRGVTDGWDAMFKAKDVCNKLGMWAIIDMSWTKDLADYIGNRKVLEVMAGNGWLAKALHGHGVDITATDSYSWSNTRKVNQVHSVKRMRGIRAVREIEADVLIVSWPPYTSNEICDICEEWGSDKPIVYIGEGEGGCCASDKFWDHFEENDNEEHNIVLPHWDCIHDFIIIGNYKGSNNA